MRADRTLGETALVERVQEQIAVADLLVASSAGQGGSLLVEGIAGIGKTRLLRETAARGRDAGFQVLLARGSALEQEFAFGVVRQLFEPLLRGGSAESLAGLFRGTAELASGALLGGPPSPTTLTGSGAVFAVFLGLYWVVANLCDDAPVLLLVDDLQWADSTSQLFLAFLGGRLSGLRLGLAASLRTDVGLPPPALVELSDLPTTVVVRPLPLTPEGVGVLVEEVLGAPAEHPFLDTCRGVTGGVPFYVLELLRQLAHEGVEPMAANADYVAQVHPVSVLRSVTGRIASASQDAISVARSIAVLGDGAAEEDVVNLSGADAVTFPQVLTRLGHAGVLVPGTARFAHPIIQSSVYEEIPPRDRAELHRRAGALLRGTGCSVEVVVRHVLRSRPAADPQVVELLRDAAGMALVSGGTTEAVVLLTRAVTEPPEPHLMAQVLYELGCAEQRAGQVNVAIEHLTAAMEVGSAAPWWGEAALVLAQALFFIGRVEDATRLVDRAGDELERSAPELSRRLRLAFLGYGRLAVSPQLALVLARLPTLRHQMGTANTPAARLLQGMLSTLNVLANEPCEPMGRMARSAWGGGDLLATEPPDSFFFFPLVYTLISTGEHDAAQGAIKTLLLESRRRGSASGTAMARTLAALAALRQGALWVAEADAMEAIALAGEHFVADLPMALGLAVESLVERGDLARAEELIADHPIVPSLAQPGFYDHYLGGRAALHLAQRRWANALDDSRQVGRRLLAWEAPTPAVVPWRSRAALALERLGDTDAATALAEEEVELAEAFGCPHTRAVALRAAGLIIGGPHGLTLVERAVEAVDDGPFELEAARANTALGRALRHRGSVVQARERLRRGLELAVRCGASPIAELARTELVAAGGRPRRWAVSGVDALTATERRICALAGAGLSNRDIAQELFVVVKTVEVHLTTSYRKLGIASRRELKGLVF